MDSDRPEPKPQAASNAWESDDPSLRSAARAKSSSFWVAPLVVCALGAVFHFVSGPDLFPAAQTTAQSSEAQRAPASVPHSMVLDVASPLLRGEELRLSPLADPSWAHAYEADEARPLTLRLWDTHDNDGDRVEVLVNGLRVDVVQILNGGTQVQVPVLKSGATVVTVKAVYDGGGGVTLGLSGGRGEVRMRVLQVGESEGVLLRE